MAIPDSFQRKYQNNLEMTLAQGANPALEEAVVWTNDTGEKIKVKDIFAQGSAKRAEARHEPTNWSDVNPNGVWLTMPEEIYEAVLLDPGDTLATMISLKSGALEQVAGVLNRGRIEETLAGFFAPIISGKDGTVTTDFPASAEIPADTGSASGDVKMNTKKLREAKKYLGQNFNARGLKRYMVLTEEDNDALLDEVPATSTDFQRAFGASVDENGNLIRMLGFNFIHLELDDPALGRLPDLATDGDGNRRNPFWVKGGLVGNYWQKLRSRAGEIPDRRFEEGIFGATRLASTRTQAGRCGIVLNAKD